MENYLNQKLTSKDVLNIFIESNRLFSPLDVEAEIYIKLNSGSSVQDWIDANDLLPWYELYQVLNKSFNIVMPSEKWKEVLEPAKKKRLIGVCEFIADNSNISNIMAKKILGKDCLSAAVFLELKKRLRKRGVQTEFLSPSTLIAPYLSNYYVELIGEVILISKGKRIFEYIKLEKRKKGLLNIFNFKIEKDRFQTENTMQTFRDLVSKIIAINR